MNGFKNYIFYRIEKKTDLQIIKFKKIVTIKAHPRK